MPPKARWGWRTPQPRKGTSSYGTVVLAALALAGSVLEATGRGEERVGEGEGRGGEVVEGAVGAEMAAGSGVVARFGFMVVVPPRFSVFAYQCLL